MQADLSRGAGRCRGTLSDDLTQLERHRLNWLQDEIAELRRTFEVDIRQHWHARRHERFAEELQPHLLALTTELQAGLREDLQRIADKYVSELGLDALGAYAADLSMPERKLQQAQPLPPRDQRQVLYAARQAISNGRTSQPVLHLVTAAVGLPGAGFLVSAGLAAATYRLNVGSLARTNEQQEAVRLLRDVLETWWRDVGLAVSDYMRDARRRLDEGLADAVAARMSDLKADAGRLKQELSRPDVAERSEAVARAKAELAQLDEGTCRLLASANAPKEERVTEGWQLAIDFGTTTTVAAARRLGESDAKMLEIGGSCAVSSAVFVAESGAILAGPQVERHADSAPERVVHAKRLLVDADCDGSTLIDGEILRDVDLIAPVLRFVHEEACDRFGGAPPTQVVLTCPAAWSDIRRQRLCDAAATAGIENPLLIEEPIAAAANLLRRDPLANVPDGVNIAVYDFGGTVDVAILKRAGDAFTLVGPVDGTDALGGDTIDHQLLRPIIDELPPAEQAALLEPEATSDPESWVRTAHQLKRTMREAKEALLQRRVQMVRLPNPPLSIDEVELDETILRQHAGATISSAVGFLADFLERSGTESSELGAIFLVGGCSRLSLLQRAVGERFPECLFLAGPIPSRRWRWELLSGSSPTRHRPRRRLR